MIPVSLLWIAEAVNGKVVTSDDAAGKTVEICEVSTDTRTISPGDLFVALKGVRNDGHEFLTLAIESGAAAVIAEESHPMVGSLGASPPVPLILVEDTLHALGALARAVRRELGLLAVVGITGSTGKTCTKDFLVSILKRRFEVAYPPGSYNNEVGLPLTVLSADLDTEVLVAEMGARTSGDIDRLADILDPDFGVITNVGVVHIGEFKSQENVANAKGELARYLEESDCLVLNQDDEWSSTMAEWTRARVVTFGKKEGSDYRGREIKVGGAGYPEFILEWEAGDFTIGLPVIGRHNVENALAAAACACEVGVGADDIVSGLEGSEISKWRLEVLEAPKGYTVINDVYNSNPRSVRAALAALKDLAGAERTIAVLGDMAELGSISVEAHREVGASLPGLGVDLLIAVGTRAEETARSAIEAGMNGGKVFFLEDLEDVTEKLRVLLRPGDVVLVKGSRFLGLERVTKGLIAGPQDAEEGF